MTSSLDIVQVPALTGSMDNYNYVLHCTEQNITAVIDPSLAEPTLEVLEAKGWTLDYILSTHHHWDHTDGNHPLKVQTGCKVVGFAEDAKRIPDIDIMLNDGDRFSVGGHEAEILYIPGHTLGHVAYYFADVQSVFVGDTLFGMGCGRMFEGTPAMFVQSLQRLCALPNDTRIYCGHEYTLNNAKFALTVEPDNAELQQRAARVRMQRERDEYTVPFTLKEEKATNPFLRLNSPSIRRHLEMVSDASEQTVFAELRQRKDRF